MTQLRYDGILYIGKHNKGDKMNETLKTLNCMNYICVDSNDDHWYACNGLRSLYEYSKISNTTFKELCTKMIHEREVTIADTRNNNNETITLSMI